MDRTCPQSDLDTIVEMAYETNPYLQLDGDRSLCAQSRAVSPCQIFKPGDQTQGQTAQFSLFAEACLLKSQNLGSKKEKKGRMRCCRCGWQRRDLSTLFGFLAGLHPVVTELVLLCNGASTGRGFPPLLLLGQQFLQLPSHSIHINAPSKGNNSPGFLKVRTDFRFIATKHYFTPSMLFYSPEKDLLYVLHHSLCALPISLAVVTTR